jgi:membrane protein DedA with SNARE-associated domain
MLMAFGALVLAGIGFPIPEEMPTIGAGIWVASNPELGPVRWLILPVCYAGVILSDVMLYFIGRRWGPYLFRHRWLAPLFPAEKRERIEYNFQHYGVKVLLFIRWIPAIRSPLFVTAGIMRVPLVRFVVADGIAAVAGHTLLFFLAYWLGDHFQTLVAQAEHTVGAVVRSVVIIAAIVAVSLFFLVHFLRRPVSTADPKELPLIGPQVAARIDSDPNPFPPEGAGQEDRGKKVEGRG